MNEQIESNSYPKFTRGEKCIFAHLVFTFSLILLIVIIYLIHLYLVDHNFQEVFIIRRSIDLKNDYSDLDTIPIGQVLINTSTTHVTAVCNTMLLTAQWSVGPGHCIAIRSDPDLYHLLHTWKIRYKHNNNSDVPIKRSIVHPHFNRDTFANNIGLVQHVTIRIPQKHNMVKINHKLLYSDEIDNLVIINWNYDKMQHKVGNVEIYPVQLMRDENCSYYMTPIIELRNYEFCITLNNNVNTVIGHGSLIVNRKFAHVLGIFAWGERQLRYLPLVILNLTKFQEWLNVITTL